MEAMTTSGSRIILRRMDIDDAIMPRGAAPESTPAVASGADNSRNGFVAWKQNDLGDDEGAGEAVPSANDDRSTDSSSTHVGVEGEGGQVGGGEDDLFLKRVREQRARRERNKSLAQDEWYTEGSDTQTTFADSFMGQPRPDVDALWSDFDLDEYPVAPANVAVVSTPTAHDHYDHHHHHHHHHYQSSPAQSPAAANASRSIRQQHESPEQTPPTSPRPRSTTPQPFNLTERPVPPKSRTLIEYEEQRRRKELDEAAECSIRIQATPLPASTILPLYERMAGKDVARRTLLAKNPTGAKSTVIEPFKMSKREKAKSSAKAKVAELKEPPDPHQQFKAKPVPKGLLDPNRWNDLQIANTLREVARTERAEWMLEQSMAPADLDRRGSPEHRQGKLYQDPHLTFRPHVNEGIPNYDADAAKFERERVRNHVVRKSTKQKPFNFRSEQLPARSLDKVKLDIALDHERLKETRWPFKAPRTKSKPPKFGPHAKAYVSLGKAAGAQVPRSTRATRMRTESVRQTTQAAVDAEMREQSRQTIKATKAHRHQRAVVLTARANDKTLEIANARDSKTKAEKEKQFALEQAFEKELAAIQQRVENRTLLMEHGKETFPVPEELMAATNFGAYGHLSELSSSAYSSAY